MIGLAKMVMKGRGKFYGQSPWTADNCRILKEMWEGGKIAKDISHEFVRLGHSITRNAVIGKANRMNIKQPPRDNSPKAKKSRPRKRIVVPATHPHAQEWKAKLPKTKLPTKIDTKINVLDPNNPGIQITELRAGTCHAIVRDGNRYNLATYCGNATEMGKSFCPGHTAIYYREHEVKFRPGRVRTR